MKTYIHIGGQYFGSKIEAELFIREILSRYKQMEPLSGNDLAFVAEILDKHPNYDVIVDCGVTRICVQHLNDRHDSRRFVAVRTDGSIRDFTWRHLTAPRTARSRVMRACRSAVRDQIQEFRTAAFARQSEQICAVSGKPICITESDVDHKPPRTFVKLVESWILSIHIQCEDVELVPVVGYEQPDRWQDPFLEENWKAYHRIHADLRVIHPWANQSLVRKEA